MAYIFEQLQEGNPYANWIRNYGDEGYLTAVQAAVQLLAAIAAGHAPGAGLRQPGDNFQQTCFTDTARAQQGKWG